MAIKWPKSVSLKVDHYLSHLTFSLYVSITAIGHSPITPKRYPVSLDNVSQLASQWSDHFVLKMAEFWMLAVISGTTIITLDLIIVVTTFTPIKKGLYRFSVFGCISSAQKAIFSTFAIFHNKTLTPILQILLIRRFNSKTNVFKVSPENFIKLALLLFELSCTKVSRMRFSVH